MTVLGVPPSATRLRATVERPRADSVAGLIGADPWSPRRITAIAVAEFVAMQWQLVPYLIRGYASYPDLSSALLVGALLAPAQCWAAAAVLRMTGRVSVAAVIWGAIPIVFTALRNLGLSHVSTEPQLVIVRFLNIASWIVFLAIAMRAIKQLPLAVFAATLAQSFFSVITWMLIERGPYYEQFRMIDALNSKSALSAVIAAIAYWIAVALTPQKPEAATPQFGIPRRA